MYDRIEYPEMPGLVDSEESKLSLSLFRFLKYLQVSTAIQHTEIDLSIRPNRRHAVCRKSVAEKHPLNHLQTMANIVTGRFYASASH